MAKVIYPSFVDHDAAQVGERRLVKFLEEKLPESYVIIPNAQYPSNFCGVVQCWEYDCLVVAPHGVYNIENKDWRGDVGGTDQVWWHNGVRRNNPLKTCRHKTAVLVGLLKEYDPSLKAVWVDSLVTLSNPHQTDKHGFSPSSRSYDRIFILNDDLIAHLTDPAKIGKSANCIQHLGYKLMNCLVWDERELPSGENQSNILEFSIKTLVHDETDDLPYREYIAETQGLVKTQKVIRAYRLDPPSLTDDQRRIRTEQIRNQSYALEKIGAHPNIFPTDSRIIESAQQFFEIFDYLPESSLRDILKKRELTYEEKLEITFGLCAALNAAHEAKVIHRAVRPENVIYNSRVARLANFTGAFFDEHIQAGFTIPRMVNENTVTAYDAPELAEHRMIAASDIYSFGVFLYELFLGKVPVANFYQLNRLGGKLPADLMPTRINALLPPWLNTVVGKSVVFDPNGRWQSVSEIHDFIRGEISASETPGARAAAATIPQELEAGMMATPELYLVEQLGSGGYSKVFKAHHRLQDSDFALKIYNESVSVRSATDEYRVLSALSHKNIVKFVYNGLTNNGRFYTMMELVKGPNLSKFTSQGDLHLPLRDVYRLADNILDALTYLQELKVPVFHRDIKPQNILCDEARDRFVLTDFNISAIADADRDLVGTQPYIPPDLIHDGMKVNWDKSADPFAFGITLYELVCREYPWPGVRMPQLGVKPEDPRKYNSKVSSAFAAFLLKSIGCTRAERFADAKEMWTALKAIGPDGIWANVQNVVVNNSGDVNTEQFVKYLNTLYSQSKFGNRGTRCAAETNPLDEATYIQTKLDTKLLTAICDGTYKLVIITGNAGDGKTAFIRKIEAGAADVKRLEHSNGATFTIAGVPFESNYDGSQDEDAKVNDDVLRTFFQPFANLDDFSAAREGRVIAINEGKLADFLSRERSLAALGDLIDRYFNSEGKVELPKGLMVINLNLRSITAPDEDGQSLFRKQLRSFCDSRFWSSCAECPCKKYCFIRYNVQTLTDQASGEAVVTRLEWLLRMVSYRRELHLTIRDLRSFISFLITSDERCEDVQRLYHQSMGSAPEKYWMHLYFNILAGDGIPSQDRLVRLVRETDVAKVAIPNIDRDLYFNLHNKKNFNGFDVRDYDILEDFNKFKRENSVRDADDRLLKKLKTRHRIQIRHHFFEGDFDEYGTRQGFFARLPYRSLSDFRELLSNTDAARLAGSKEALAAAVSLSEGCKSGRFAKNYLLLASSHVADPRARTYRRFKLEDFELIIEKPGHLVSFIEYENDSILFRSKRDHGIRLAVTLDLYEMLEYIKRGYSPSVNDLQGHFIELKVFKTLLENRRYDEILVTRNDREFHLISLDSETNRICVKALTEEA